MYLALFPSHTREEDSGMGKSRNIWALHTQPQRLDTVQLAREKRTSEEAVVASSAPQQQQQQQQRGRRVDIRGKKRKGEYDLRQLEGLNYLFTKKRKGETFQAQKKTQQKKALEKQIKLLRKQLAGGASRDDLREAQLAQIVRTSKEADTVDERAGEDALLLDEDENNILLNESSTEEGEEEAGSDDDDDEEENIDTAWNRHLLEKLQGKKLPTAQQKLDYAELVQLCKQNEEEAERDKRDKRRLLKNLQTAKRKNEQDTGRSRLNVELLEKSSAEALELLKRKEEARREKKIMSTLLKGQKGVSEKPIRRHDKHPPLAESDSVDDEDAVYQDHQQKLASLLAQFD